MSRAVLPEGTRVGFVALHAQVAHGFFDKFHRLHGTLHVGGHRKQFTGHLLFHIDDDKEFLHVQFTVAEIVAVEAN